MMRSLIIGLAFILTSCGASGTPTTTLPPSTTTTTSAPALGTDGTWEGALADPGGEYRARLYLWGCTTPGVVCGSLEYMAPGDVETVLCASDLTVTAVTDAVLELSELLVYHPWHCFPTSLNVRPLADGTLQLEQLVGGEVCCTGTFTRLSQGVVVEELPEPVVLAGIGTATAVVNLPGNSTQYAASGDGVIWMPLEDVGSLARIDSVTGTLAGVSLVGDPNAEAEYHSDPHSVVVGDAGVWVTQAAERAVARVDPQTGAVIETIAIGVVPYALAIDGSTLWVSSFIDDAVVVVDLASGTVIGSITVAKPTGITTGAGAVWVVEHRRDSVVRIDRETFAIVATIRVTPTDGPNDVCGNCIENVVFAFDSVWTADNEARTVTRVDPETNSVSATFALPHRSWSVTAGGGYIWSSQFEEGSPEAGGIARIDPITGEVVTAQLSALGVFWAEDALWAFAPARRGDLLFRIEVDPAP